MGLLLTKVTFRRPYVLQRWFEESDDPAVWEIVIIGAGGVTSPEAVPRMNINRAVARIVGCARCVFILCSVRK